MPHGSGDTLSDEWVSVGIRTDPVADQLRRLEGLMETVGSTIPDSEARHHDWSTFAYRWAELGVLRSGIPTAAQSQLGSRIARIVTDVDRAFLTWMERRYARAPQPAAQSASHGPPPAALSEPSALGHFSEQSRAHRRRWACSGPVGRAPGRSCKPAAAASLPRKRRVRLGANDHVRFPAGDLRREAAVLLPFEH